MLPSDIIETVDWISNPVDWISNPVDHPSLYILSYMPPELFLL